MNTPLITRLLRLTGRHEDAARGIAIKLCILALPFVAVLRQEIRLFAVATWLVLILEHLQRVNRLRVEHLAVHLFKTGKIVGLPPQTGRAMEATHAFRSGFWKTRRWAIQASQWPPACGLAVLVLSQAGPSPLPAGLGLGWAALAGWLASFPARGLFILSDAQCIKAQCQGLDAQGELLRFNQSLQRG